MHPFIWSWTLDQALQIGWFVATQCTKLTGTHWSQSSQANDRGGGHTNAGILATSKILWVDSDCFGLEGWTNFIFWFMMNYDEFIQLEWCVRSSFLFGRLWLEGGLSFCSVVNHNNGITNVCLTRRSYTADCRCIEQSKVTKLETDLSISLTS